MQLREGSPTFDEVSWNNRDKDRKNANSFLKRRLPSRRPNVKSVFYCCEIGHIKKINLMFFACV